MRRLALSTWETVRLVALNTPRPGMHEFCDVREVETSNPTPHCIATVCHVCSRWPQDQGPMRVECSDGLSVELCVGVLLFPCVLWRRRFLGDDTTVKRFFCILIWISLHFSPRRWRMHFNMHHYTFPIFFHCEKITQNSFDGLTGIITRWLRSIAK